MFLKNTLRKGDEHLNKVIGIVVANNTTKEVEIMARKAVELKSLDGLKLSTTTISYLKRTRKSIDSIIKEGRLYAYLQDRNIYHPSDASPKWMGELVSALRAAGFIRPADDFVMSFNVAALYTAVYGESAMFITSVEQLSNSQYEAFKSLANEELEEVKLRLNGILTEREFEVIYYRFGLDGRSPRLLDSVGEYYGVTRERIRQIEARALRRLRRPDTKLPAVFDAPDELNKIAKRLNAELEELHKDPAFIRADEIVKELGRMENLPFRYNCKCTMNDVTNQMIEELNLSVRAYNCLKRANISTISDIIKLPKEDWPKVRNLGRKCLVEIEEKMHQAGYKGFSTNSQLILS